MRSEDESLVRMARHGRMGRPQGRQRFKVAAGGCGTTGADVGPLVDARYAPDHFLFSFLALPRYSASGPMQVLPLVPPRPENPQRFGNHG